MLILRAMVQFSCSSYSLVGDIDVGNEVFRCRRRGCLGVSDRLIDEGHGFLVDPLDLGALDDARLDHFGDKRLDAVAVGADVLDFSLAAISLLVAFKMAEETDHLALEQRRTAAFARSLDDLACRFINRKEIGAVHGYPG